MDNACQKNNVNSSKYWRIPLHSGKGGLQMDERIVILYSPYTDEDLLDAVLSKCEDYANKHFEKNSSFEPYEFRDGCELVVLSDNDVRSVEKKHLVIIDD